jgi:hypothetical protein
MTVVFYGQSSQLYAKTLPIGGFGQFDRLVIGHLLVVLREIYSTASNLAKVKFLDNSQYNTVYNNRIY